MQNESTSQNNTKEKIYVFDKEHVDFLSISYNYLL